MAHAGKPARPPSARPSAGSDSSGELPTSTDRQTEQNLPFNFRLLLVHGLFGQTGFRLTPGCFGAEGFQISLVVLFVRNVDYSCL